MITLDDYIIENNIKRIDFLKIDTEGYEFNVIKGLGEHIKNVKYMLTTHFIKLCTLYISVVRPNTPD